MRIYAKSAKIARHEETIASLKNSGVGVMPTDTIYGLVGQALKPKTVERIYRLKKRRGDVPFIIIISDIEDLKLFDIKPTPPVKNILNKLWPNPVSIILPLSTKNKDQIKKFRYLHRGKNSLSFRLPKNKKIQNLIKQTGPLIATSANIHGEPPAETISKAKKYFDKNVDFYLNAGKLKSPPSTLISICGAKTEVIRQGKFKIQKKLVVNK